MSKYTEREDWWTPGQIKFTWEQVEWVLWNYPIISNGQWPKDPNVREDVPSEGQLPSVIRHRRRSWAPFERPCEIAAEIDERMKLVGEDSSILRDLYILKMPGWKCAELRRMPLRTFWRHRNTAMEIMTGWHRKQS